MEKGEFIRRIQIILLIQKMIKQWSQGTGRLPTHTLSLSLVPVSSLYWPHSLSLQIPPNVRKPTCQKSLGFILQYLPLDKDRCLLGLGLEGKKKKLGKAYDWHGLRCLALDDSIRVKNFARSLRNTIVGRSQKKREVIPRKRTWCWAG